MLNLTKTINPFHKFYISYPEITEVHCDYDGTGVTFSNNVVKFFFLFGMASSLYVITPLLYRPALSLYQYIRSLRNTPLFTECNQKYKKSYAVIYGANNIIGKAYAKKLSGLGYGLVLVDRDLEKLNRLENELVVENGGQQLSIKKITIDMEASFDKHKFEQKFKRFFENGISQQNGQSGSKNLDIESVSTSQEQDGNRRPMMNGGEDIRVFVNCKNLRLKEDRQYESYELSEINALVCYNIKGYSLLMHMVLKNMLSQKKGSIINIIRQSEMSSSVPHSQLLYSSSSDFVAAMANHTRKSYSNDGINVLNVFYSKDDEDKRIDEIINSSLKYIGVKDSISI